MSTDTDLILSSLSLDEPVTRAELEEATGLEAKTLSNRLFALHTKGLIAKNPEGAGWLLSGDSAKRTQNIPKIIPAKEPAGEAPVPKKPGPNPKPAKATKALPPPASSVPQANGRACEFAIAESGAILFKITTGPKAGELGEIGCGDAMALYRLMSAVEFIVKNA
jgi:hypothetical protein